MLLGSSMLRRVAPPKPNAGRVLCGSRFGSVLRAEGGTIINGATTYNLSHLVAPKYGYAGSPTLLQSDVPAELVLDTATFFFATSAFYAISNGKAFAWAPSNSYGECGVGTKAAVTVPTRVLIPEDETVKYIATMSYAAAFLCESGNVYACGNDSSYRAGGGDTLVDPTIPQKLNISGKVKQIESSYVGLLMLLEDGRLLAQGANTRNCLFHATEGANLTRREVLADVDWIVENAGYDSASAVRLKDGSIICCGVNNKYMFGIGKLSYVWPVAQVPYADRAVRAFINSGYFFMILDDGTVRAGGGDWNFGAPKDPNGLLSVVAIPEKNVKDIMVDYSATTVVYQCEDGSYYMTGTPKVSSVLSCAGRSPDAHVVATPTRMFEGRVVDRKKSLANSSNYSFITATGALLFGGSGGNDGLPSGTTYSANGGSISLYASHVISQYGKIASSSLSDLRTSTGGAGVFVFEDGRVAICGDTVREFVPAGSTFNRNPVLIDFPEPIASGNCEATQNYYFSAFFVAKSGNLYVLGHNRDGCLGLPKSTTRVDVPTLLALPNGEKAKAVRASYGQGSYILSENGTLYGCGVNTYGQLGQGHQNPVDGLVKIADGVTSFSVYGRACAYVSGGRHYAFGYPSYGNLDGTSNMLLSPKMTDLQNVTEVMLAYSVSLAKADGLWYVIGGDAVYPFLITAPPSGGYKTWTRLDSINAFFEGAEPAHASSYLITAKNGHAYVTGSTPASMGSVGYYDQAQKIQTLPFTIGK